MSVWRVNDEAATSNFLAELYDDSDVDIQENSDLESDNEQQCIDEAGDRLPDAPSIFLVTPLARRRQSAGEGDKSRSPLRGGRLADPIPVTGSFDQDDTLSTGEEEVDVKAELDEDDFYAPDALYVCEMTVGDTSIVNRSEGETSVDDVNERDMTEGDRATIDRNVRGNVRGRARGGQRGRAGVRGRVGRVREAIRRAVGNQRAVRDPPTEIWTTDDNVPSDFLQKVKDVVRRRELRVQEIGRRRKQGRGNDSAIDDDEEFQDATDGRGNSLLEGEDLRFEWLPMQSFQSKEESFLPQRTGSVECHQTPYDAFRSFWDDGILHHIVNEINRYASTITSYAFQSHWYPTNPHEVLCLFAFWMMLGIIRMPTIRSCFSTDTALKTEIFRRMFSYTRYKHLVRALKFVEPTTGDSAAGSDRLYSLRPIIHHINLKFQANYVLSKDIYIDETPTFGKGRLNIEQYIRSKASKFGIKSFELCESATGYLWSFIVYTGNQNSFDLAQISEVLNSTAVVVNLIGPLLNKGHRLFMNNWFNSPVLARYLKRNGTDCVGTLRLSRQDVPALIKYAPLKQGQFLARTSGDITVLSWQDHKRITMISTCHGSDVGLARVQSKPSTTTMPLKPQVVLDYDISMGGVDVKDQMLEPYLIERQRCNKSYMKLFKRLLNCSILNSRILLESSKQCRQDQLSFTLELVDAILTHHLQSQASSTETNGSSHPSSGSAPSMAQAHWPIRVEQREFDRKNNRQSRNRCKQCSKSHVLTRTPYMCETCKVPLCVYPCFKQYHIT